MPHLWEEEKCEEFEHFWKRLLSVVVNVTSQSGPKKKKKQFWHSKPTLRASFIFGRKFFVKKSWSQRASHGGKVAESEAHTDPAPAGYHTP